MPPTTDHIPFIGAVKDEWQMFSDNPSDYDMGLPIGFGASSIVYAANYNPRDGSRPIPCALKVVDLDRLPQQSLRLLRRETQLMSLSKHPNVLRVRGSWMDGHKLYIALRLMNSGSAADVMRYGWPGGMEEEVVKCILKQALEGLNYLHINGFIHRDIKAANLLIDDDGTVLLGDLGVAASLSDEDATPTSSASKQAANVVAGIDRSRPSQIPHGHRICKRKSFVGTPCWMAPELILGKQYDSKADIWSFGITAVELSQGRAPRSREAPSKVLMKTVQDAPPTFDRQGGQYRYSKTFKEMVESCLVKDPALRPTAAQLLESPFFKSAKRKNYLVGAILKDLPPLTKRQERRRQPSVRSSINTYASWDFPSGPVSPSTSVFPRTHSITQGQQTQLSTLPTDGNRSHALKRFDDAVREGVAAVRRLQPVDYVEQHASESGDDDSTASTSSAVGATSSSNSSNPTTPEIGVTPLPGDISLSCSPVDVGTVRPGSGQLKREDTKSGREKSEREWQGTVRAVVSNSSKRPSTADGLRSSRPTQPISRADAQSHSQSQSQDISQRLTRPSTAVGAGTPKSRSDTASGSVRKTSVWKKLKKGMGVDDDSARGGSATIGRKSSFVGRMLERTVSNTEPGRQRGGSN